MDHLPNDPNSDVQWHELVQAIEDVDHLALDENFERTLDTFAIFKQTTFVQGDSPLRVDNDSVFRGNYFTRCIEHPRITLQETTLATDIRGGFVDIKGSFILNGKEFRILSRKGKLLTHSESDNFPPMPIEPHDITALLAALASQFSYERISCVSAFSEQLESAEDDYHQLATAVSLMGNFIGTSTKTVRSYLPGDTEAIIAEMTEVETPDNSDVRNQLLLGTTSDLFGLTDEISLSQHQTALEDTYTVEERLATHALTQRPAILHKVALDEYPFQHQPGAVVAPYTETSGPEEVRRYAILCRELMCAYTKLSTDEPS